MKSIPHNPVNRQFVWSAKRKGLIGQIAKDRTVLRPHPVIRGVVWGAVKLIPICGELEEVPAHEKVLGKPTGVGSFGRPIQASPRTETRTEPKKLRPCEESRMRTLVKAEAKITFVVCCPTNR